MVPSIQLARPFARNWRSLLVEGLERAAGLVLLAVSSPVLIFAALITAILSKRSPLVAHLRVGWNDEPFWMLKLRSMWPREAPSDRRSNWIEYIVADTDAESKPSFDARVTSRFAAFCRRHSIDELPQFWHVAAGEMSLVGPRPLTRPEIARHFGARSGELLSVKPGLTGLWQVSGRSKVKFPQRAALDLALVGGLTPSLYFTIILRTCASLVRGQGAW